MIAKLIVFLQWIESSEKLKHRVDFFSSMLFLFVTAIGAYKVLKEILFQRNYGYYYDSYRSTSEWVFQSQLTENTFIFSLTIFLLVSLIVIYVYSIYKRIIEREFSVVGLIVNSALPIFTGIILVALYAMERDFTKWYILLFGGLYALSPYLLFLAGFPKINTGLCKYLLDFSKKYIIAFLIGFAVFIVLFFLGNFREFRYMDFSELVLFLSLIVVPYSIVTWLILTYAWTTLEEVDELSWKNILRGGIGLAFIFLVIWISPNWKNLMIENRIQAAQSILKKEGNTKKGFEKAANITFLKWALKDQYKNETGYGYADLYAKIYDESIESAIDDELDVNKYRSRTSNGTSMLARGENAKVELNFAKHESQILSDINALETTVTYEFQNTDTQNQEVIYSIALPDADAVMTDLRLGLNLELIGVIAPRGAAAKVYADSLRRNTDPALLEQTGPTTYRLRVFPVLSKNDPKTQGRQRVQYHYITPIHPGMSLTLMPKTDILNLKLTASSEVMTRLVEGPKAYVQDSEKTSDIAFLNRGKVVDLDMMKNLKEAPLFCNINTYPNLDLSKLSNTQKNLTKNIVFIDISKSAGNDRTIRARYQELIDAWKNTGVVLDIYTYNSEVTSAGYDLSDISFWGNTDMAKVITYIADNTIENANIVILTDDDSYESVSPENQNLDYKKLKSNRISLIQIGDGIRTLKTEVTKSLLATEGSLLAISLDTPVSTTIKDIFKEKNTPTSCEKYTGTSTGALSALQGYQDSRRIFGEDISNEATRLETILSGAIFSGGLDNPTLQYLIKGSIVEGTRPIVVRTNMGTIEVFDEGKIMSFSHFEEPEMYISKKLGKSTGTVLYIGKVYGSSDVAITYTLIGNNTILKNKSVILKPNSTQDSFQEEIARTAHIVNQSVSLIALETDRQKADLERYSEQEDKYDTKYENFTGNPSTPMPAFRGDMAIGNAVAERSMAFGTTKSTASTLSKGGSADSLKMGTTSVSTDFSLGSSSSSSSSIVQYIIVIILFPLIAWFVLRKKPKAKQEAKKEEPKN